MQRTYRYKGDTFAPSIILLLLAYLDTRPVYIPPSLYCLVIYLLSQCPYTSTLDIKPRYCRKNFDAFSELFAGELDDVMTVLVHFSKALCTEVKPCKISRFDFYRT